MKTSCFAKNDSIVHLFAELSMAGCDLDIALAFKYWGFEAEIQKM